MWNVWQIRDIKVLLNYIPTAIPLRKSRDGEPGSNEQRLSNQRLAKRRVVIEHINRLLKIFRILSERYRNRRRRFGLRFNLIAGLYNYDLALTN